MHDQREVSKEGRLPLHIGKEPVRICGGEYLVVGRPDRSMLATEVSNLTGLGRVDVAGGGIAPAVRVQVGTGAVAVSILRDWLLVDVVD